MERSDNKDRRRLYGDLAWTWPIISPPEGYADETEEIIRSINKYARSPVRKVLNLGCGGGHNDFTLKKHFDVHGVDISEEMLALARKLNPEVKYVKGDMRSVRLGKTYDVVTIFDSINYMTTVDDLRSALVTAYDHLVPGGMFITYLEVWKESFRQNQISHLTRSRGEIEVTLVENYYDPDPNDFCYEANFVYFIRRAGILTVEHDAHLLGLFPLDIWPEIIKDAGFEFDRHPSSITSSIGESCPVLIGIKA